MTVPGPARRDPRAPQPVHPPTTATDPDRFTGFLDHTTLTLTMACTKADLLAALARQDPDGPYDEVVATYVHELAHTGQALGTTVGYYAWLLRSVQDDHVTRMLRWLVDAGLPIELPLLEYLPTVGADPDHGDPVLTGLLQGWQLAEAMAMELAGTPRAHLRAAMAFPVVATTWEQRWSRLQLGILELYERRGSRWPQEFFLALASEPVRPTPEAFEALLVALPSAYSYTVAGVMESAALAIEAYPDDEETLRPVLDGGAGIEGGEEIELYLLLERTRRTYPGLTTASLLATHLAACDVALNPPCLPIHRLDRRGVDLRELHPVGRVVEIWNALGDAVRPAADLDDAARCADDICAALGWTPVTAVLERAARGYRRDGTDPRGRAFATAVHGRLGYRPLLHDARVPLRGTGPLAEAYRSQLRPAFWSFTDQWLPGTADHERTDALTLTTLRSAWTRTMVRGGEATLRVPVPMTPAALDSYAVRLAVALSTEVGKRLRPPEVTNPLGS